MIPNNKMFDGKEQVEIEGKMFYRSYEINRKGKVRLIIRIISINSIYKQGIALGFSMDPKFEGDIFLNQQKLTQPLRQNQHLVLPLSLFEKNKLVMDMDIKEGYIRIANASDFLDDYPEMIKLISIQTGRTRDKFRGNGYASGFTAAFLYGNAFWIENISENHYRFHCNDHKLDDDFDDLIFDLEIMENKEKLE